MGLGALLALQAVSPAPDFSKNGSQTCTGGKTVNISSRASVWISHSWAGGGYRPLYNPYRDLKVSWTNYASTWYVVDCDFEITPWAGDCVQ